MYAQLEDLRCPWLKTHRLVARRVLMQCLLPDHWLDVTQKGTVYWGTGSSIDKAQKQCRLLDHHRLAV